jgi:hypothetical protein
MYFQIPVALVVDDEIAVLSSRGVPIGATCKIEPVEGDTPVKRRSGV